MWFTIGFTAACAAGIYLMSGNWYLLMGLFCLVGCFAACFVRTKAVRITAVVLLGSVVGFAWLWGFDGLYLSAARQYDGELVPLTITATDYSYETAYGQAFDGKTELCGKTYQVRCYLNEDTSISPGNTVTGDFRLRYTVGGEQEATYHQGKGIFLLATKKSDVTITTGTLRLLDHAAVLRHKLLSLIESAFPSDVAGFAKALLLGDTTDLTYRQDRAFQVSGLRHVVAVSGLHVSILFSLIYMAFGRQRVLNVVFGVPLLLVFAAVAGFSPSIVRACIMQVLMLLALLVDKEYDPPTALAFAVLVILGVNPRTITSVSLQLSVGCMIGIFAFYEPIHQYILSLGKLKQKSKGKSTRAKLIRWFVGSVSVTLSAMVVTTPLCAIYFGMVSLVGVLANLLTLWVISFIFYGIMLVCVLSIIWVPLGNTLAWLISWPIRYVLTVAGLLADFPLAAVYTDSVYIVCWLVIVYVLLGVFLLMKEKRPVTLMVCMLASLCSCIALSWLDPVMEDTRVSVTDVGQGQSVLLQQDQQYYLVDCGGKHDGITADTVANFLLSQGIFRLDGVVLTHYDADHAGGLLNLLSSVDTDAIYMPDITDTNGIRQQLEDTYPEKIKLITVQEDLKLNGANLTLYPGESGANDNESSVCVLFQSQNCDILISGDRSASGERALLDKVQLPQLELLVAGHHGSKGATSLDLLLVTHPQAVAISVGADNPYGHPGQELLDRLARFGCQVYRTDLQGTITFRG